MRPRWKLAVGVRPGLQKLKALAVFQRLSRLFEPKSGEKSSLFASEVSSSEGVWPGPCAATASAKMTSSGRARWTRRKRRRAWPWSGQGRRPAAWDRGDTPAGAGEASCVGPTWGASVWLQRTA